MKDITSDRCFAPWLAEARKRGYASIIAIPLLVNAERFGRIVELPGQAGADLDKMALLRTLCNKRSRQSV